MEHVAEPFGSSLTTTLDIAEYFKFRTEREDFVMVEIGHGAKPAAFADPDNFSGGRAYIGIEAWLRDPLNLKRDVIDLRPYKNRNIFFIDRSTVKTNIDGFSDTFAILPDSSADELLLANLLGDPEVVHGSINNANILSESRRLIGQVGKLVIRETVTPVVIGSQLELLTSAGLQTEAIVRPDNAEAWSKLEEVYGSGGFHIFEHPDSYYIFAGT
jgi:hypothetical protein